MRPAGADGEGEAVILFFCCIPCKFMLYSPVLCFFCTAPLEQLRILGSPVRLEPRRAKPAGAGGSCAVKIKPLEYYHESEFFRP